MKNPESLGKFRQVGINELKNDQEVIWHDEWSNLEFNVDGGFIKRLGETVSKHHREILLTAIGGTIFAVIVAKGLRRKGRDMLELKK